MKRIETIKISAVKEHTREVEIFICDLCGYESKEKGMFRICGICNRLVCQVAKGCARSDKFEMGDYPTTHCLNCYGLRDKYNLEFEAFEEEAWNKREALLKRIKNESLRL